MHSATTEPQVKPSLVLTTALESRIVLQFRFMVGKWLPTFGAVLGFIIGFAIVVG
ncbi:MAG TPA: hypothetical protein VE130_08820 [Nitrososphaeraceae archaeon]|nr:hypothetical protein [Nitrososphaeraceae archaeon]